MTVFGLDLAPGQRILLNSEPYVIGKKLGEGFSADVYHIYSERFPDKQFVMRSPRVSPNDGENAAVGDVENIRQSLKGFSLVTSIDPDGKKWRWTPQVFEAPLNPHRKIRVYERLIGWTRTDAEPVVVIPLAKGTLVDIVARSTNHSFEEKLRLASSLYEDLLPELRNLIQEKLVHGDIKPGNILVGFDGKSGLSDFEGLIHQGNQTYRATRNFYAPEYDVGDGHLTYAADLYSTGKTLLWILLKEKDWNRFGVSWDAFYRSSQYKVITKEISRIEKLVLSSNNENQASIMEMLSFMRHSLHADPVTRILSLRKNVSKFKDIELPKERDVLSSLTRQSVKMNTKAALENVLQAFKNGFHGSTSAGKASTKMNSSPAMINESSFDLANLKSLFQSTRLTETHILQLAEAGIEPTELLQLEKGLTSKSNEVRAWAALRLTLIGDFDKKVLDIFLADTSIYLDPNLILKLSKLDPQNLEHIAHILDLLKTETETYSKPQGLLNLLSVVKLESVMNQDTVVHFLNSRNFHIRQFFAKFYIKQNYELQWLTDKLVKACLEGDGALLIDNLTDLKKFITNAHYSLLVKSAMDHSSKGSNESQKALAHLGGTTPFLENYFNTRYPGFKLEEITGFYRFRQSTPPAVNSCLSFYGKN